MLKIKKFTPLFTGLVTTMDKFSKDVYENGILTIKAGSIKEYQTVLSVGDSVRGIKPGDMVLIDPKHYAKMKHEKGSLKDGIVTDNMVLGYDFEILEIDGKECLHLQDRDIRGIVEGEEEFESDLIIPNNKIIL